MLPVPATVSHRGRNAHQQAADLFKTAPHTSTILGLLPFFGAIAMQLGYTILYVQDVRKTIAFYTAAFGLQARFIHESGDYGELDTGSTSLAFCAHAMLQQMGKTPSAADAKAPCFEIALVTDNVPAALTQALAAGAEKIQDPKQMPWGQTIAYVADLNGFLVELCTPVAA
jgi:catechol 2,3-dioxygenase-like lactoylglutathione lyase family enzyme